MTASNHPLRDQVAAVIYDAEDRWLRTVDGSPNQASYAAADRLIEAGLVVAASNSDAPARAGDPDTDWARQEADRLRREPLC